MAAVLIAGVLVAERARAADDDPGLPAIEKRALAHHLTDLTDCLAYYSIAQIAVEKAGARDQADRIGAVKSTLLDRSFIVMRAIDMTQETALARQRTAVKKQMALIGNDLGNFAVLTAKYGDFCKSVVENPEARLDYWKKTLRQDRQR